MLVYLSAHWAASFSWQRSMFWAANLWHIFICSSSVWAYEVGSMLLFHLIVPRARATGTQASRLFLRKNGNIMVTECTAML